MKRVFLVAIIFVASSLFASCVLEQKGVVNVDFKAYKTPLKIGVGGKFNTVLYNNAVKTADDLKALLVGSTVEIDASSVNSANASRDVKLDKFFFGLMSTKTIRAKILDVTTKVYGAKGKPLSGIIKVHIEMNGVAHDAELRYRYKGEILQADGYIDLGDFHALRALNSLNKACYDLHQGKTWSDVAIGFKMKIIANCK
jgi:hypothetical protein